MWLPGNEVNTLVDFTSLVLNALGCPLSFKNLTYPKYHCVSHCQKAQLAIRSYQFN